MKASIHISRLLALLPVVALAAGCSGTYPAGPTSAATGVSATGSGDATGTATGGASFADLGSNTACRLINEVDLRILPGPAQIKVTFEVRYRYSQPVIELCRVAPKWTATRGGLHVSKDGFHAAMERQAGVRTRVTATAPNGVDASLTF